jgi:phage tail protein X
MNTPYTTQSGDTWTGIALKAYGSVLQVQPIIDANPGISLNPVFDGGILLLIPVQDQVTINTQNLPPWKR